MKSVQHRAAQANRVWWVGLALAGCSSESSHEQALASVFCEVDSAETVALNDESVHGSANDLIDALEAMGPLLTDLQGVGPVPATVHVEDVFTLAFEPQGATLLNYTGEPGVASIGPDDCDSGEVLRVDVEVTLAGDAGLQASGLATVSFPTADPRDAWIYAPQWLTVTSQGGVYAQVAEDHSCNGDPWFEFLVGLGGVDAPLAIAGMRLHDGWGVMVAGTCDNPNFQRTQGILTGYASPMP